jgi:hypothetical protein
MTTDPNKKSMRTFQCRDVLWESFEQLARDLECSVDYLVNESMKQYVRQRQQGPRTPFPTATTGENPQLGVTGTMRPIAPQGPAIRPARPVAPPFAPPFAPPPMPAMPTAPQARIFPTPPPPSEHAPPPVIPRAAAVPVLPNAAQVLVVYYAGQTFPVTKDRFIIGRGKHATDLRLADPNVSRQHAMVELSAEGAAIVDLDSTNGVEFAGERVKRRIIQTGDLYILCGHELRFEYHWPPA